MRLSLKLKFAATATLVFLLSAGSVFAAPACKGQNKNDPGCPGAEPPPEPPPGPAVVDSVSVDWFNQVLVVRGSGLDGVGDFGLGSFQGPLSVGPGGTPTEVQLEFNSDLADEVTEPGSYLLTSDGTSQLTLYFQWAVIDPADSVCPCIDEWASLAPRWGTEDSECIEVEGPGNNDPADISATILSIPGDPGSVPQYPIGASFYPGEPDQSYCRLVEVDEQLSATDLVNIPINENQQADCRQALAENVCLSISTIP